MVFPPESRQSHTLKVPGPRSGMEMSTGPLPLSSSGSLGRQKHALLAPVRWCPSQAPPSCRSCSCVSQRSGVCFFKKKTHATQRGWGGIGGSNEFTSERLRPPGRGRGERGDPYSHPPGETRGGQENHLGCELAATARQQRCWQAPPEGVEPESASGRKQGRRECRTHVAGPRRPAQG